VQLKRSGNSYKACCPFHQEKTPSFHVLPQKNFYHCFGCGVSGDAISFLREHDSLSFVEAVEELARIAGVNVPRDDRGQEEYDTRRRLLDGLNQASLLYQEALKRHPQREVVTRYMARRGLSEDVIERFALGFAPAEKHYLGRVATPEVVKAMIRTRNISDKYQQGFDLFQNRLMFPIRNMNGKVVAFGGRTLGDDKAKYINSPESEVFHKSSEIYGLFEATRANVRLDRLLIVEGYMDVVSLAQFGITYAVATLGTATNEENLSQLLKRCTRLVFCFDGDNAGRQAARKAMENMLPLYREGLELSFLLLPEGEDPDTLVRREGRVAFERRIEQARPLSQFLFQIYAEDLELSVPEQRGVLKERAEAQINRVGSSVLRSALRNELNRILFRRPESGGRASVVQLAEAGTVRVLRSPDSTLCLALYYRPALALELVTLLDDVRGYERARELAAFIHAHGIDSTGKLLLALASGESEYRERFSGLFEQMDWLPDEAQLMPEFEDVKRRILTEKKRGTGFTTTKMNKLPSQLSDEEKAAVRALKGS
jgi:DNA primase